MSLCANFPHGENQLHTFVSYSFPCQTPFCQTAPLLSSVAWQQNLTEYCREGSTSTAISTTFTSDVVGQHNKIGGIHFGAALVVPSHLKILIPVGTTVIIVANVKFQYSISRFNNTYTQTLHGMSGDCSTFIAALEKNVFFFH
jgi:hypothetical protein